jgi:hypothetical protein
MKSGAPPVVVAIQLGSMFDKERKEFGSLPAGGNY